ncbi:MAG: hypothetical protein ACYSVY_25135 [Planctomycetota bacterium]|jgi:hypothetical protein
MARDPYLDWAGSTPDARDRKTLKPKLANRRLVRNPVRSARDLAFPDIDEEAPLGPEPAAEPRQIRPGPEVSPIAPQPAAPGDTAPSVISPGAPPVQEMSDEEFRAHVERVLEEDTQGFTPAPYPEESSYLLPQDTPWGWTIKDDDSLVVDRVMAELRVSDQVTGLSEEGVAVPLPEDREDRTKFFGSAIPALLRA